MELIQKAIQEFPFVSLVAFMWWVTRRDLVEEIKSLKAALAEKDKQLDKITEAFDSLSLALELIKDRLSR